MRALCICARVGDDNHRFAGDCESDARCVNIGVYGVAKRVMIHAAAGQAPFGFFFFF